jgi:butyrate kinase
MQHYMLSSGIVLDHLKYPVIKTLFKNSERNNISNYRPISLLITFSNIFQTVLRIRLSELKNKNNILVDKQFGFRIKLTTEKAIYKLTTEILKDLNIKSIVGGIFRKHEEGFYCVNHEILLSELKYNGITGKANHYSNYLKDRCL